MLNYSHLKDLAKQYKARATDFFALSPGNDPYYMVDNENARAQGEWFADLHKKYWHLLTDKIVRSLHYALLGYQVYLPDGKTPYENSDKHYEKLLEAAKTARYLELVPMETIVESKNKPDVFIPKEKPRPKLDYDPGYWYGIELYSFPDLPHYTLSDFPDNQRYHLEIWCEKAYSPFRELASKYGAVYQQGQGEQTVECAHMLIERRNQYKRPIRIFYISDYDPAGASMPLAVARKLEFMMENIRGNIDEPDVRLYNLALTKEQVTRYNLPTKPFAKDKKDSRKADWIAHHGNEVVELNAIETQPQYKGELVRIVEDAIKRYYDPFLTSNAFSARSRFREQLEGIQQDIYYRYPRLDRLRKEYNDLVAEVEPRLEKLNAEIKETWQQISDDLNWQMPDFEEYLRENPLPEPKIAQELDDPLYDSNRDYFSQLAVYKNHQRKRIVF